MSCAEGVGLGRLVEYLLMQDDDALEDHFFGCAACSDRLGWLAELTAAMPMVLERRGGQRLVLTRELVDRLDRGGVRMRHYHFDDNREIACTVRPGDDLVVSWIPVTAAADEIIACDMLGPGDVVLATSDDMPFDRTRGELVLGEPAAGLRRLPDLVMRLQLRAIGPSGTRALGEYIYNHSAPR